MTKKGKIILIVSAGVVMATGAMIYVFAKDAQRKKAYSTVVPPEYAKEMIRQILDKK